MKKSNVIVFVLLALASAFFLWLWYFLGLNRVDEPLDLVLSIVWWLVIVVAIAGIAGYTMPSQDLAGALRLWRFLLALCASVGGLFGIAAGAAALVFHLAGIESFGVAYLTPFAANAGEQVEGRTVLRQPLPKAKLREAALKTRNRRNQK